MRARRIVFWSIVVLWMGLIFFFSAQPAEISSKQSGGAISFLLSKFSSSYNFLLPSEQLEKIELWQHTVRKITHFLIYAVLGMLCLAALYQHKLKVWMRPIMASLIAIIYAASDEGHQLFVHGRSCEFRDVCIDSCGAIAGVLFLMLCIKFISVISKKSGV